MLNHVLNNREGRRVAVIVNDMSEVNIDANLVREEALIIAHRKSWLKCLTDAFVARDDLLEEVSRLAGEGRFDYLLIESTGVSEPLPVAQTFTLLMN